MTRVMPEAHDALVTVVAHMAVPARRRRRLPGRRTLLATAGALVVASSAVAATGGMSVFDRPATPDDALPGAQGLADHLDRIAKRSIDVSSSRLLFESPYKAVYVTKAGSGVCMHIVRVYGGVGTSCSDDQFVSGGVPGDTYGFAPSYVNRVTFTLSDGTTQTEAITNNLWHGPAEARRADLALPSGEIKTIHFAPLSALGVELQVCPDGTPLRPEADCADKDTWTGQIGEK